MKNKQKTGTKQDCELTWWKPKHKVSWDMVKSIVNRQRSIALGLTLVFGILVIAPGNVTALTPQEKLGQTFDNVRNFLIGVGIALTGIMIVLAGIKWTATRGHPEEQSQVKAWLLSIGIGLILIISSTVLIDIAKGLIVT